MKDCVHDPSFAQPVSDTQVVHNRLFVAEHLTFADTIIAEVAYKHRLTVREMKASTRRWRISRPRQEAMYELRLRTKLSLSQIARKFGLKDHTTVVQGSDSHAQRNGLPIIRAHEARVGGCA